MNLCFKFSLIVVFSQASILSFAQNVGISIINPLGKLHVKGSSDVSQLIIDANSAQSNTNPLIKLRNSFGADLLWINSDDTTNCFIGLKAGRTNNAGGGGVKNTKMISLNLIALSLTRFVDPIE